MLLSKWVGEAVRKVPILVEHHGLNRMCTNVILKPSIL